MKKITYPSYLIVLLLVAVSCDDSAVSTKQKENITEAYSSMKDGLITLKSGAVVKKVGDTFYWQGDIILSEKQLTTLDKHGDIIVKDPEKTTNEEKVHPVYNVPAQAGDDGTAIPRSFGINPTPYNMWAMVRFVYADNLTTYRKNKIKQALQHWEANTMFDSIMLLVSLHTTQIMGSNTPMLNS